MLDQLRDFGSGVVEVFPSEQGTGLVVVEFDMYISARVVLGAVQSLAKPPLFWNISKPHLKCCLVVVEPDDALGVAEQPVHHGLRQREVENVNFSVYRAPCVLGEKVFAILHRQIFGPVAELEPCREGGPEPVRAVRVVDDKRFHFTLRIFVCFCPRSSSMNQSSSFHFTSIP